MGISKFLKILSYQNSVRWVVRSLQLERVFRKLYYAWARPRDGIVRLDVAGVRAQFCVRTPGELRVLDPAGGAQGEQHNLELLIAVLRSGGSVFDIGSNVGLYTVLLAKVVEMGAQVIAFEPQGESYAHLLDNLQLNGLTNVRCFRKALSDRSGQEKLYRGDQNADSSMIRPPTGTDMGYEVVEVIEGDRLVEEQNLPVPRVVKIDVEGCEYAVLRGLRRTLGQPGCEVVSCEIHPHLLPADVKTGEVLALLKSLGFSRIEIRQRRDTFHALCYKESVSA